jgi:NADPH2:quinone reductase
VNTAALDDLRKLIEGGAVKVQVDRVFDLEQIREAFEARESGEVRGKIVVRIG